MAHYVLAKNPWYLLETGEQAWGMARWDDCLRPCIATLLQIPPDRLPDPRLDERLDAGDDPETIVRESWETLHGWLHQRGLRLTFHQKPPPARRWVGVCRPKKGSTAFAADHCVVMDGLGGRVLFDPVVSLEAPDGMRPRTWRLPDIGYGITIEKKEQ